MKLITKELEKIFEKYPIGSQDGLGGDAKVIAKFFNPLGAGTWLITEAEKTKNGDYEMFGYCHLGDSDMAELGYVMLSQLEEINLPFGLKIERDLYMPKDCTLLQAMKNTGITPPDYMVRDHQERVYERVCKQFLSLNLNQILLEGKDEIVSAIVDNDALDKIDIDKITIENYKEYQDCFSGLGVYKTYQELFKDTEMNEGIEIDLEDLKDELYDKNGKWNYEVSKEDILELKSFGEEIDISLLEKNNDTISYEI